MEKNQNAKFAKFALSAAACFALLMAVMVASAVSAAPMPEPVTEVATAVETVRPSEAIEAPKPAMPVESVAADDADLELKLKEALAAVKKVIQIDDKAYPNFSYYYYPDSFGGDNWNFNWASANWDANINVSVLGNGRILYYGKYEYNEKTQANRVKFAEVTKKEAADKAEAFLKKLLGSEFDGYRLYQQSISYPSDRYNLIYMLAKNGYDYPEFQLYVDVDKITGEVLAFSNYSYSYMTHEAPRFDFQKAASVISVEEALKSYLENIGLELVYASYYDWEAREYTVHPVYRLSGAYGKYISAVDGSVLDTADVLGIVPLPSPRAEAALAYSADMGGGAEEVYFSEAELLELAKAKNYITAEQAIDKMVKAFDLDLGDLENFTKYISLQADYMEKDRYLWSISLYSQSETVYENYYASLDARNGAILYYSGGSYPVYYDYGQMGDEPEYMYTYKQAKEIVIKKIKELSPVDFSNFELVGQGDEETAAYYYFYFVRKVNGIPFESNGVYVYFDNINGKINSYSFQWYEKAKFPKLEGLVSPEEALAGIAGFAGYNIYYASGNQAEDGRINAVLVYKFGAYAMADAFTGKCLGWDLKEAKAPEFEPDYKDLGGHWSEKTVRTLTDNGIYVWGGEAFDPNKPITKIEFVNYLRFFVYNSYYFTQLDSSMFVNQFAYALMDKYASDADADKILTKQEAAKIVCELAGYGELGKHTEIFAYPFNDDNCDDEYKGYVAIIKAFGLILGDELGNYDGTKELTRAEAAAIVYNIVMTFAGK